jgi:hypothetical protein
MEQRRHDLIAGLDGKIELTKLSFGVTSSALTANFERNNKGPSASGTS